MGHKARGVWVWVWVGGRTTQASLVSSAMIRVDPKRTTHSLRLRSTFFNPFENQIKQMGLPTVWLSIRPKKKNTVWLWSIILGCTSVPTT